MAATLRTKKDDAAKRQLTAELEAVARRLQTTVGMPTAEGSGGNFLDVAQGVESQELAFLTASRLIERVNRLDLALTRVSDGQYGTCDECGAPIPPKRLLVLPDATTCVGCQERLEHRGAAVYGSAESITKSSGW